MAVGTILSFDEVKGYGFISPEGGGEDVFVHANDFGEQRRLVRPGLKVEFEPTEGTRGVKASVARLINPDAVPHHSRTRPAEDRLDDEYDVLTAAEFRAEVTDLLVEKVPTLTGAQIAQIRQHLLAFARAHEWIED